ncbi:hypothetical protein Aph02nite_22380 [Actinoplanes philippinensis]|nr:hypothetical protein Aph02nite_22380 [Actinoplanes philippinensis]
MVVLRAEVAAQDFTRSVVEVQAVAAGRLHAGVAVVDGHFDAAVVQGLGEGQPTDPRPDDHDSHVAPSFRVMSVDG